VNRRLITDEDALVERIQHLVRQPASRCVPAGIGDDCAAVRGPSETSLFLLKTDVVVEGRHFREADVPQAVGWKAVCRAVSDIAACGGRPKHALITCVLRPKQTGVWLTQMYRGIEKAARTFGFHVVGGEMARTEGPMVINVAMTGEVDEKHFVRRCGGRSGDVLFVTGVLGGSLASGWHLRFQPRVEEAVWLVRHFHIHAMMDLSDGLAADLPRLAKASDVGFTLDTSFLPRRRGVTPEQALGDGEDFELLFAVGRVDADRLEIEWRKNFPKLRLTRIGTLARKGIREGLGAVRGYDHFKV